MKELIYTILELEEWNKMATCDFCSKFENKNNKAICQIRFHSKATGEIIDNACTCENCEEKELPILPFERRPNAFYERQINRLREELSTAEVEVDTHLEALEIAED